MQLTHNQQKVMKVIDERALTVNQITAELNTNQTPKSNNHWGERWTEGQVRSIVTRLVRREILERGVSNYVPGEREYTFYITNYAYGVWKEQFN